MEVIDNDFDGLEEIFMAVKMTSLSDPPFGGANLAGNAMVQPVALGPTWAAEETTVDENMGPSPFCKKALTKQVDLARAVSLPIRAAVDTGTTHKMELLFGF